MSPERRDLAGQRDSVASVAARAVLVLEARNELLDTKILDHLLQDSVVLRFDLLDLDLRLLGDEVHSALSFLL